MSALGDHVVDPLREERRRARRAEREALAQAVLANPPPLPAPRAGVIRRIDGEVLHASASRPVVRWIVSERSSEGREQHTIVGKVYGKGDGATVHALLARLRDCGFDGPYAVPAPLGWVPSRRLLLQSEAPPRTLYAGLSAPRESMDDVRRTGEWLARLHAVTGTDLRPLPVRFEAEKVERYVSQLAALRPDLAQVLRVLQRDLLPRLRAAGRDLLVPTHGDFQPKNVHLDSARIMVIDFDRAALAPAGRDLGHFIGQATTMGAAHGCPSRHTEAWSLALVEGYLAAGGSAHAVATTPDYVVRTFLEVLYYRLVVRPVPDASFAAGWLDACAGWLDRDLLDDR